VPRPISTPLKEGRHDMTIDLTKGQRISLEKNNSALIFLDLKLCQTNTTKEELLPIG
jgi:hypothetical protein